jgi:hypothetical protein
MLRAEIGKIENRKTTISETRATSLKKNQLKLTKIYQDCQRKQEKPCTASIRNETAYCYIPVNIKRLIRESNEQLST